MTGLLSNVLGVDINTVDYLSEMKDILKIAIFFYEGFICLP